MNGQGDCTSRRGRGGDRAAASEGLGRGHGACSWVMVALERSGAQVVVVADLCCRVVGGVRVEIGRVVVVVVVCGAFG